MKTNWSSLSMNGSRALTMLGAPEDEYSPVGSRWRRKQIGGPSVPIVPYRDSHFLLLVHSTNLFTMVIF